MAKNKGVTLAASLIYMESLGKDIKQIACKICRFLALA
jgi:hypothetical protein